MRSIFLVWVLGASAAAGCGTFVESTAINAPPHRLTARSSRSVEVFASGPPARPHVDVALLEVEQMHGLSETGTASMIERAREEAAAMGCDAIVLGGMTERDGAPWGSQWRLLDPGSTKREATCVVYLDRPSPSLARRRGSPTAADPRPSAMGSGAVGLAGASPLAEAATPPPPIRQRIDPEEPPAR